MRIWSRASRSLFVAHSIVIVSFVFFPSSVKRSVPTGSGLDGNIRTVKTSFSGGTISRSVGVVIFTVQMFFTGDLSSSLRASRCFLLLLHHFQVVVQACKFLL